ncbi:AbiJ-NTD4 domain-containing protein [Pseudoduganella sp. UC29_106]|uniref:AbiJ-NTD4 domain-containing protein n=1 Tax=Pseudoduganella sp. UC29_106 TaxID=3374553 RepID=UPI003756A95A
MKFSERYGYSAVQSAFQRESVDHGLRTQLWNILKVRIWDRYNRYQAYDLSSRIDGLLQRLWFDHFNKDLDELPDFHGQDGAYEFLKDHFFGCDWYEVYDFLEALASDQGYLFDESSRRWINEVLEKQNAAYRFVSDQIVEITDKTEINSIEEALEAADASSRAHIETALRMLSNKEQPDYRNSVKESISAVEAACRIVTNSPSATLGAALKRVKNLHPAMSGAFSQLYGYTNDESGIRHALSDESDITYEDAKFMLVACSAFVSYLMVATRKN